MKAGGADSSIDDAGTVAGANAFALGNPAASQANENTAVPEASVIDGGSSAARGASQSTGDAARNHGVPDTTDNTDENSTGVDGEVSDGAHLTCCPMTILRA